jgi:hypothetical protein
LLHILYTNRAAIDVFRHLGRAESSLEGLVA